MDEFSLDGLLDEAAKTEEVVLDTEETVEETTTKTESTSSSTTGNLELSKSDFSRLLFILKLLESTCTDVDIKKGVLRQKSNSSQVIFDIDLESTKYKKTDLIPVINSG